MIKVLKLDRRGTVARAIQVGGAFAASAVLHGCGSVTMIPETQPLRRMGMFFFWQWVGIVGEAVVERRGFVPAGMYRAWKGLPGWTKGLLRFVYVHAWFYYTAPLLCDDFAAGGLWLVEPVPVSFWRGVGYGVKGDERFWYWGGEWARWVQGKRWWLSGWGF